MRILSLGAGVQSSAIALMIEHGEFPSIDAAIFSDTGWEPGSVYKQLDFIDSKTSFPIHRVSAGNIRDDLINANKMGTRVASLPFFTENGGIGRRQCTNDYKIVPVQKKLRELLGYKPKQRIPENTVELIIGISFDEVQRMKPSQTKWIKHSFPLIDKRLTRYHCIEWFKKHDYPEPIKSSCIGCPFHNDAAWIEIKEQSPSEFEDAVLVDSVIRDGSRKMKNKQYMHRQLKPLSEVEFADNRNQADLFGNECSGMCGV